MQTVDAMLQKFQDHMGGELALTPHTVDAWRKDRVGVDAQLGWENLSIPHSFTQQLTVANYSPDTILLACPTNLLRDYVWAITQMWAAQYLLLVLNDFKPPSTFRQDALDWINKHNENSPVHTTLATIATYNGYTPDEAFERSTA